MVKEEEATFLKSYQFEISYQYIDSKKRKREREMSQYSFQQIALTERKHFLLWKSSLKGKDYQREFWEIPDNWLIVYFYLLYIGVLGAIWWPWWVWIWSSFFSLPEVTILRTHKVRNSGFYKIYFLIVSISRVSLDCLWLENI